MSYEPTEWRTGDVVGANQLNNLERGLADVDSRYTPTVWETGDVVTATKLNKLEQGVANANPNSTQTITGTVAEPFGDMSILEIDDFRKALLDNTANAVMVVEASSVGSEDLTAPFSALGADGMVFQAAGIEANTGSAVFASYAITYDGGAPSSCVFNGVYHAIFNYVSEESSNCEIIDLSEYGSLVPTTLTIIWHPLPESED